MKRLTCFCCGKGLRQGEKLSPSLFSLFLNDLENYMFTNNGFNLELNDDYLDVYLKLIVLLYADDTVIFSKSEDQLVSVFNTFTNNCSLWKLKINYDKTKILVFGDRTRRNRNIVVDNHEIETVDSFKFLGVMFSKSRKFAMANSHVVNEVLSL